jgi:hypothetical protein
MKAVCVVFLEEKKSHCYIAFIVGWKSIFVLSSLKKKEWYINYFDWWTLIDEWEPLLYWLYHWMEAYVCSFYYWMEANDVLLASINEWELKVVVFYLIFLMK